MKAILELAQLGYVFELVDGRVRYTHGNERPDPEVVRPMLDYIRRHREEAVSFLKGIEAEAVALLDQIDNMDRLDWCRP